MSDDTDPEYQWCAERRREALEYLDRQRVKHGRLGEAPAWHVYPHLSLWAVESAQSPGWVGWWVICGDCPTDYVTCSGDRTPRSAIDAIAARWREASALLARGEQHPDFSVGDSDSAQALAPLLAARAEILSRWTADDSMWD
jgi:hypothetical protein